MKVISNNTTILSEEQIRHLILLIQKGNSKAKDQLVKSLLPLVKHNAKSFVNRGVSFEVLVHEGTIALYNAAVNFNLDSEAHFYQYCKVSIVRRLDEVVIQQGSVIRIPANVVKEYRKIRTFVTDYEAKYQDTPSSKTIAQHLGLSVEKVRNLESFSNQQVESLDCCTNEHSKCIELSLSLNRETAESGILAREALNTLRECLGAFTEREQFILIHRFELMGASPLSGEQIAAQLGCTSQRVYQIEKRALQKLKAMPAMQRLRYDLCA